MLCSPDFLNEEEERVALQIHHMKDVLVKKGVKFKSDIYNSMISQASRNEWRYKLKH